MTAQLKVVYADLGGSHGQGTFGGITKNLPLAIGTLLMFGITAQNSCLQQKLLYPCRHTASCAFRGCQFRCREAAFRLITLPGDCHPAGA